MEDYIFKTAALTAWQKWLNQWKHDYDLEIIKLIHHHSNDGSSSTCTIYLKRTPKQEE